MSLQVWLPLTKDTRNQGLCGGNIITSGVTFADGGKLGSKYLSAGTITIPASVCKTFFNKNNMSFAFWLYPIGTSSSAIIMGQNAMSPGNNRMYSIFQYSTPNSLHLSWQDETSSTTFLGGSWTDFFPADTWTHCCITYNGSKAIIYRNGEQYTTANGTSNRAEFEYDYPISGSSLRKLQDVRIYDHCLSPMEVKELSKGLVLHYPLNRQGWGQENLVTGTNPNDWHSLTLTDGTNQCINIFGDATRGYLQATTAGLEVGDVVHVSFDIKFSSNITATNTGTNAITVQGSANNGATWGGLSYSATGCGGIQRTEINNIINSNSKQGHIHTWFIVTSAMLDGTYTGKLHTNVRFDYYTGIVYVKATKVEKGINATSWCPNSADPLYITMGLNSTTEYDCSGFCNNGTRTGTFNWTSDTPKYQVSTSLSGNNNWIQASSSIFNIKEAITVNIWAYKDDWSSSINLGTPFSCIQGGGVGWSADSSSAYMNVYCGTGTSSNSYATLATTKSKLTSGWHMLTLTYDGLVCKSYIDGALDKSLTKYTTKTPIYYNTGTGIFIGGEADGNTTTPKNLFKGKVSDLRIYATALSATDVLALYQNSAYIDSNGNVYGKIHN